MRVFSSTALLRDCILVVANLTSLLMSYVPHRQLRRLDDDNEADPHELAYEAEQDDDTIQRVLQELGL